MSLDFSAYSNPYWLASRGITNVTLNDPAKQQTLNQLLGRSSATSTSSSGSVPTSAPVSGFQAGYPTGTAMANNSFYTGNYAAPNAPTTVGWGGVPGDIKELPNAYMRQAWALASQPYQQYTGERIAGFSPEQQQAMGMITQRATQGDPTLQAGNQMVQNTLNGQYMSPDSNPYLKGTYDAMANRMADAYGRGTASQTMGQFNSAGAFGGSAMQEVQKANNQAFADSLGQLANQVYGDNYQQERGRQLQAGLMAPTYGNQAYQDAAALQGVGAAKQGMDQARLGQTYSDWLAAKNQPYQGLDLLGGLLGTGQNAQSLAQQADQFNRANQSSSTANYLGAGLGLLGTLGSTNLGGQSLLDRAWSGLMGNDTNNAVNNLVDYSGLFSSGAG